MKVAKKHISFGKRRAKPIVWPLLTLSIVVLLALATILVQFLTRTGFFYAPGILTLDDTLTDSEKSILNEIFADQKLDRDLTISATMSLTKPELAEGEFLVDIYVPITDFYSTETTISAQDLDEIISNPGSPIESETLISIDNLDNSKKLLAIDGNYYLDTFNSGAIFRILKFTSEAYASEVAPKISDYDGSLLSKSFPSADSVLTFAQTGVTALSRGMHAQLNSVGDATFFSSEISDFLSQFDLTHTSNESSFTDSANTNNICSDWRFVDTLIDIGLDIVELTGNHNQDCGDDAASETIDKYNELGIEIVGGGKTAEEAAEPLEISQKNTNITFFAYNLSTGGATYDDTPGANQYYEESAAAEIKAAKDAGNFVIVDVQYYECAMYAATYEDTTCDYADSSAGDQVGFFRHLIDLGADLVVGTSAHQTQTFELYGDGVIYYGLGNLFFDQVWWPGTTRSLVLGHYFYNGKLLQTKLTGTVYGDDMQVKILDEETTAWWIDRLVSVRPDPALSDVVKTSAPDVDLASTDESLTSIVETWRTEVGGNTSVIVYDLDNNTTLTAANPLEDYGTASLYKLFVVYTGYHLLQSGVWSPDWSAGYTGHTYLECLDLAIRESNSPCAEYLWSQIGHSELDNLISTRNITNSNISSLVSNAEDILKIMMLFYTLPDLKNDSYVAQIKDSFLNQPITTADWRRGLPAGFSDQVNVYNKVGWEWGGSRWNIYHDAAIVEFPETNRHFAVVVLTNYVDNTEISELGASLESYLSTL